MEYIGENVITPAVVDRILRGGTPRKIKTGSAPYFRIIRTAIDDGEVALLRSVKDNVNLRAMFIPQQEIDGDQLKMRVISAKLPGAQAVESLVRKAFDVYFRSSGLIYGFSSRSEEADEEFLVFKLPRLVLKVDRRKFPRIETGSLPVKYRRECSTVLFTEKQFYRLECESLDISVGGLGLGIASVVDDKRYEKVFIVGTETPVEFVLGSKPLFARIKIVYLDPKVERAGAVVCDVRDNRRHPAVKLVEAWIDKIMFGEPVDLSKKETRKKPKRTAIVSALRVKEAMKELAARDKQKEASPEAGEIPDTEEEAAAELSGVSEVIRPPGQKPLDSDKSPLRVLLIDSHVSECRLVELFLINRDDSKVSVSIVHDSHTGLRTVLKDRPDMVLIDPHLEGDINNGVLLLQRIQANRILREIPVIGLTSALDRVTVQKLLAAGVRHVVSKKSRLSVLWEKICDTVDLSRYA